MSANFRRKGASPTNHYWCQKPRVIAFSCDIKISAVHCLVLPQSTRVTNGRTEERTDGQTERITTPKTALRHPVKTVDQEQNRYSQKSVIFSDFLDLVVKRRYQYEF